MDLDEKVSPALLDELLLGRTHLRLHTALGIDVHSRQTVLIERLLNDPLGLG